MSPLTPADLAEARAYSSGSIWRMEPGSVVSDDDCKRIQAAEACTEIGADTRPAALSMTKHRKTAGNAALVLIAAPAIAAAVGIASFIAQHWPG